MFSNINKMQANNASIFDSFPIKGTNLGKADSHCIRVVVLRDEDAGHKVSESVSQGIYHHDHQAEGGNQGLQCVIR